MLRRPDYVRYGTDGDLDGLFCKVCGTPIAGMEAIGRPKGPPTMRFRRNRLYTEIKIECSDGSFHVTNGCSNCLNMNMSSELLKEVMEADFLEQTPTLPKTVAAKLRTRVPVRVVVVNRGGRETL